jgi:protein-L-isoaspartate(D-aspartate) O-methyltransferase
MAPFDAIIVTAAAPALPGPLRAQLSTNNGRMVIPIGSRQNQHLERITRFGETWNIEALDRVRFVPLLGRYGFGAPSYSADNGEAHV